MRPIGKFIDETDEELARRARVGSLDCFEELVRRYQVPLMRLIQRQWPSRHDAEDVIQEAFLRAWQSIGSYREGALFRPWLYVIASRVAIDLSRRRRNGGPIFEDVPDATNIGPLFRAVRDESRTHLWQLVRQVLADEPFVAVWLHYGESMSSGEIAGIFGRSRMWVKTTLFRARGKIRAALKQSRQFEGIEKLEISGQA
jgi:RNA polymerase sigma-70 factor (ECF subfamily)